MPCRASRESSHLEYSGINIVAIHKHMTDDESRILFLHYWGKGKGVDLAASLKAALDETK